MKKMMNSNMLQSTRGRMMFHPGGSVKTAPKNMGPTGKIQSGHFRGLGNMPMVGEYAGQVRKLDTTSGKPANRKHPYGSHMGYMEQSVNPSKRGK